MIKCEFTTGQMELLGQLLYATIKPNCTNDPKAKYFKRNLTFDPQSKTLANDMADVRKLLVTLTRAVDEIMLSLATNK